MAHRLLVRNDVETFVLESHAVHVHDAKIAQGRDTFRGGKLVSHRDVFFGNRYTRDVAAEFLRCPDGKATNAATGVQYPSTAADIEAAQQHFIGPQ